MDDNPESMVTTAQALAATTTYTVVGTATTGAEAVALARQLRPDLVLLDFAMPGMSGLQTASRLHALSHPPRVIMLSHYDLPEYRGAAVRAGADGFVIKDRLASEIPAVFAALDAGRHVQRMGP